MSDVTIDVANNLMEVHQKNVEPWKITLVDTGETTMTGGRLRRINNYLNDSTFCLTYGDGLADVNLRALVEMHKSHGCLATVTAVQPPGRYGSLEFAEDNIITGFQEKMQGDGGWVNGGFFVLEPSVINYIQDDSMPWEQKPLELLAKEKQLKAFHHNGFWQPMDTLRDKRLLEELWATGTHHGSCGKVNLMFKGKRVLVTGHTGFKGSWLALWLSARS